MKLGARIFKTGVAVALSLYLAMLFNMEPVVFAAVAAVLSIQPSLYRSWQAIIEQVQANVIGAFLAITCSYLLGNDPFIVGFVVILVIAINLHFKWESSIPLAIITVIAIMESTTGNFLLFAVDRFMLILLGTFSSILVNVVFLPPRYEHKLYAKIKENNQHILTYLRTSTSREMNDKSIRQEIQRLKEELIQIEYLYLLYKEERTYFRKTNYAKIRKLVLFRQMIQTVQKSLYLLRHMERYHTDLVEIPADVLELFQQQIELLTNYNEKVLLKYEQKIIIQRPFQPPEDVLEVRKKLVERFFDTYEAEKVQYKQDWISLLPIIAQVIDYSDYLVRLDKLIGGYHSFHQTKK